MQKVELVCGTCGKVDKGNGLWLGSEKQGKGTHKSAMCPECCHEKFPQFYDDYKPPAKRKLFYFELPALISKYLKNHKQSAFNPRILEK